MEAEQKFCSFGKLCFPRALFRGQRLRKPCGPYQVRFLPVSYFRVQDVLLGRFAPMRELRGFLSGDVVWRFPVFHENGTLLRHERISA